MDVRCPQCQTLYELDDEQVRSARPVTLKCSQCHHVFRLEGKSVVVQENQRRWMIRRKKSGDIVYLASLDNLHESIMRRECLKEDEISRTGNKWVVLGSISEFAPMFSVVDSISAMGGSTISSIATEMPAAVAPPAETPSKPAPAAESLMPTMPMAPARERVRTAIQFGGSTPPPQPAQRTEDVTKKISGTGPQPPVADIADEPMPAVEASPADETSWTVDLEHEAEVSGSHPVQSREARGGGMAWIGIILVLAVAGGVAALVLPKLEAKSAGKAVPIVKPEDPRPPQAPVADPRADVDRAVAAALEAAYRQNDAVWTFWHETASAPFYVALDTAYTAADEASVGVELETQLKEARTALENGRLEQASRGFQQVLVKDPDNARAISGLGWALLELGRTQEAAKQFTKAIQANPDEGDAYIGLGTAHRQLGDLKKAHDAYDKYLGRFPRGPKASIASYQVEQLKKQLGL